jgi:hypothetical protein
MVRKYYQLAFCSCNSWPFKFATSYWFFCNIFFTTSFLVVANQKLIKISPTIWANFFDRNQWSSKLFNENTIKGAKALLILVGGGKTPPRTKNEVSGQ